MILILAEKPSVAKAIANALGKAEQNEGYLKVDSYIITWAVGHLVSLAKPESYHHEWKSWNIDHLPMIPERLKLVVNKRTSKQFRIVKDWITSSEVEKIIFATDAGPEGELIARWIYFKSNGRKLVERLWISSITREAILDGMKHLKPASEFDLLFQSAAARARADWLVGLNATRVITAVMRSKDASATNYTAGRVQTPTLCKIVERERKITDFKPEIYYEVTAVFKDEKDSIYSGKWIDLSKKTSKINQRERAEQIVQETKGKKTRNVKVSQEQAKVPPPTFLSLSALLQQASKKFNVSVSKVQDIAQSLYDKGLITYPRTADHLVTPDVAALFPEILSRLKDQGYAEMIPKKVPSLINNPRYVGPVSDHHAIIPTGKQKKLQGIELQVFDYICRVFIAAHLPDGIDTKREVVTTVEGHTFISHETSIRTPGWRIVWGYHKEKFHLESIKLPVTVAAVDILEQTTKPPSRYTEASIMKEMERNSIGTPATRAGILEKLIKQKYIESEDLKLFAKEKGIELIDYLQDSDLIKVELTARWEERLEQIRNGKLAVSDFNREMDSFVLSFVEANRHQMNETKHKAKILGECPRCKQGKVIKVSRDDKVFYGCSRYRDGCRFFISGEIAGQVIKEEDVKQLLKKGKMKKKKFQFNSGKKTAALVLQQDGTTTFDFQSGLLSKLFSNKRSW